MLLNLFVNRIGFKASETLHPEPGARPKSLATSKDLNWQKQCSGFTIAFFDSLQAFTYFETKVSHGRETDKFWRFGNTDQFRTLSVIRWLFGNVRWLQAHDLELGLCNGRIWNPGWACWGRNDVCVWVEGMTARRKHISNYKHICQKCHGSDYLWLIPFAQRLAPPDSFQQGTTLKLSSWCIFVYYTIIYIRMYENLKCSFQWLGAIVLIQGTCMSDIQAQL